MSLFMPYVLILLVSFVASVSALPLAARDVVDPPITSPTAATIWHVGQKQTVTWNATGLPANPSNPVGMLVLGYLFNNSEHLMLDSPLATNLNYSVGQAQVLVPDVPTRTDYIVVLFGDSGNASPKFTIINDASSSTSIAPSPTPTTPQGSTPPATSPSSPSPPSSPSSPSPPPSPPNLNPGNSGDSSSSAPKAASPMTTTTPASPTRTTSAHSSTVVVTATGTSTPSSTQSSAAWHKHVPSLSKPIGAVLAVVYFVFS